MKKNLKTLLLFAILSVGLNSAASVQDKPVDNTVKYTEKYLCTVKTTDDKAYLLDIE